MSSQIRGVEILNIIRRCPDHWLVFIETILPSR